MYHLLLIMSALDFQNFFFDFFVFLVGNIFESKQEKNS